MTANTIFRFAADAVLGLAVFMAITVAALGPSAAAGLLALSGEGPAAPIMTAALARSPGANDPQVILFVLAAVFSALFALNFAFVRHLTRAVRARSAITRTGLRDGQATRQD
jgi:hypothetical protein